MVARGAFRRRDAGFTMIELLAVIAIMGVLAGIATLGVRQFRQNAAQSACGSDVDQVTMAASAYLAKQGAPIPGKTSQERLRTLNEGQYLQGMPAAAASITLAADGKVTATCL